MNDLHLSAWLIGGLVALASLFLMLWLRERAWRRRLERLTNHYRSWCQDLSTHD